ncbi:MAG: Putative lipase, partial [uncultured Gemmatimonadetes bacterium]
APARSPPDGGAPAGGRGSAAEAGSHPVRARMAGRGGAVERDEGALQGGWLARRGAVRVDPGSARGQCRRRGPDRGARGPDPGGHGRRAGRHRHPLHGRPIRPLLRQEPAQRRQGGRVGIAGRPQPRHLRRRAVLRRRVPRDAARLALSGRAEPGRRDAGHRALRHLALPLRRDHRPARDGDPHRRRQPPDGLHLPPGAPARHGRVPGRTRLHQEQRGSHRDTETRRRTPLCYRTGAGRTV